MILIRILVPLILLATLVIWVLGTSRRLKAIALWVALVSFIVTGAVVAILALDTSGQESGPVRIPTPTLIPAPTRAPEGPSYETACKTFWTLNKDIEDGALTDAEERSARLDEFRTNAAFPTVTQEFKDLVDAYIAAVELRFAMESEPSDLEMDEIEKEIRNARVKISSECVRREG